MLKWISFLPSKQTLHVRVVPGAQIKIKFYKMKKIILATALIFLLLIIFVPVFTNAQDTGGIVPCSGSDCTICSFFQMLSRIYTFIVFQIATPLAIIALIVGGIFIMLAGGNPNLLGTGKKIVYSALIGLALVFGSYVIIGFILYIIGYVNIANWATLSISC